MSSHVNVYTISLVTFLVAVWYPMAHQLMLFPRKDPEQGRVLNVVGPNDTPGLTDFRSVLCSFVLLLCTVKLYTYYTCDIKVTTSSSY